MPGNKSRTTRKAKKRSAGQQSSLAAARDARKENQTVAVNIPAMMGKHSSSCTVSPCQGHSFTSI